MGFFFWPRTVYHCGWQDAMAALMGTRKPKLGLSQQTLSYESSQTLCSIDREGASLLEL
jgi:hypothetical protein